MLKHKLDCKAPFQRVQVFIQLKHDIELGTMKSHKPIPCGVKTSFNLPQNAYLQFFLLFHATKIISVIEVVRSFTSVSFIKKQGGSLS